VTATVSDDAARGRPVAVDGLELWADVRGPDDGVAVLLLAGADSPGFRFTPALVDPLVSAGHRVIRYDHRDCGRSTRVPPDQAYRLADLASDAVGLLDRLGVVEAHLVGRSMGAMVAQVMALDHPARVRSLTLVGTSPAPGDERLPGPEDHFVEAMTERLFAGPPGDDPGRVDWIVGLYELLAGTAYPFERDRQRALAEAEVATGWQAETGHGVAVHASPGRLDRLAEIRVPTLVVHGTADPVFPVAHGRALADGIDGAVYAEVEGLGHELPDAFVADLLPMLRRNLAR